MVRSSGDNGFDPDERRELKRVVPRVPELLDALDTRIFWRRAYNTLKRAALIVVAIAAGLTTMAGAVVVVKEAIKRMWAL